MMVYPTQDAYAKARPFTASAQIDPYSLPPWAMKKAASEEAPSTVPGLGKDSEAPESLDTRDSDSSVD